MGGEKPKERILDRARVTQNQGALGKIVEHERRENQPEPRQLDRLAPEMAEIGIERFAARHCQEHESERHQSDPAMIGQKPDGVDRVGRREDMRIIEQMSEASHRKRKEPDQHHRPEQRRDPRGSTRLHGEQTDQDHHRQRQHGVLERGSNELQPFDCRQHGNCRCDHRVAIEHRRPDHPERKDDCGSTAEHASGKRRQRERAALAIVVGPQQDQDVLNRYDDRQSPQDQRQHAEDDVARDRTIPDRRLDRHVKRVERTRSDVTVDNPDAAERQCERADLRVGAGAAPGDGYFMRDIGHWGRCRLSQAALIASCRQPRHVARSRIGNHSRMRSIRGRDITAPCGEPRRGLGSSRESVHA